MRGVFRGTVPSTCGFCANPGHGRQNCTVAEGGMPCPVTLCQGREGVQRTKGKHDLMVCVSRSPLQSWPYHTLSSILHSAPLYCHSLEAMSGTCNILSKPPSFLIFINLSYYEEWQMQEKIKQIKLITGIHPMPEFILSSKDPNYLTLVSWRHL